MSYHDCCAALIKTRSKWKLRGRFSTSLKDGFMKKKNLFSLQHCVTFLWRLTQVNMLSSTLKTGLLGFQSWYYICCVSIISHRGELEI